MQMPSQPAAPKLRPLPDANTNPRRAKARCASACRLGLWGWGVGSEPGSEIYGWTAKRALIRAYFWLLLSAVDELVLGIMPRELRHNRDCSRVLKSVTDQHQLRNNIAASVEKRLTFRRAPLVSTDMSRSAPAALERPGAGTGGVSSY